MSSICEREKVCANVNVASREGNNKQMLILIKQGGAVDVMDNRGWRPLHEAAHGNHTECMQTLLDQEEVDINWVSFMGASALLLAAAEGQLDSVKLLVERKADVNLADSMDTTPLMAAVKACSIDCVTMLLAAGANVNCQSYRGTSPLHQAVTDGFVDIARVLLEHGAHLYLQEEYQITPIFTAAHYGQHDCLQLLLNTADKSKQTYLVNMPAEDGGTPLYLAAQEGHADCVRLLLHFGANANLATTSPVALPLHAAAQFDHIGCVSQLLLVTDMAKLQECDANVLDLCFCHDDTALTEYILHNGVDPNYMHKLSSDDHFEPKVLRYVQHGIHFSRRVGPLTWLAMLHGDQSTAILHAHVLLKAGTNPNATTRLQVPPLLAALNSRNLGVAKLLINAGASVNIYHPHVMGNLSLIMCLHYWKGLSLMLLCAARAHSLFDTTTQAQQCGPDNYPSSDDEYQVRERHSGSVMCLYELLIAARYLMSRTGVTVTHLLSLLLYFVGNVRMDPRIESLVDKPQEWNEITAVTENPRSMMHFCRQTIRQSIGPHRLLRDKGQVLLPIPQPLIDYLNYREQNMDLGRGIF